MFSTNHSSFIELLYEQGDTKGLEEQKVLTQEVIDKLIEIIDRIDFKELRIYQTRLEVSNDILSLIDEKLCLLKNNEQKEKPGKNEGLSGIMGKE